MTGELDDFMYCPDVDMSSRVCEVEINEDGLKLVVVFGSTILGFVASEVLIGSCRLVILTGLNNAGGNDELLT